MNKLCELLGEFFDGELDPKTAEEVRVHIGECSSCQLSLRNLVLEEVVAGTSKSEVAAERGAAVVPFRPPRRRPKARIVAVVAALAMAAGLALVVGGFPWQSGRDRSGLVAHLGPTLPVQARFATASLSGYRPYDVERGGGAPPRRIPLAVLAQLEEKGDVHALVAGQALNGDLAAAAAALKAAPDDPSSAVDRAALALLRRAPDVALSAARSALARRPENPQALWNAALAAEDMGLPVVAAGYFTRVVKLGEPGWSDDAGRRAERLLAGHEAAKRRRGTALEQAAAMVDEHRPMMAEGVRAQSGLARSHFYDAVRGAASAGEVTALMPVAEELDHLRGGGFLSAYARRVAAQDFSARARVAMLHARARRTTDAPQDWMGLFEEARRGGFDDLTFAAGAMLLRQGRLPPADALFVHSLAEATGDPWLILVALESEAWNALYGLRDYAVAEARLAEASKLCASQPFAYRCASAEALLAATYVALGRLDLGREHLDRACSHARREDDPELDLMILHIAAEVRAGQTAGDIDPLVVAGAYLEERALRTGDCTSRLYQQDYLALAALERNRRRDLVEHSDAARALSRGECAEVGPRINRALARAHMLQHDGAGDEVAALKAELLELRHPDLTPGEAALVDQIEGRLLVERDPEAARRLLLRAIAASDTVGERDALARQNRLGSYAILALDAGRRGDYPAAFVLRAEAMRIAPPSRCAVAVTGEDRLVVTVRGGDGNTRGSYRAVPEGQPFVAAAEVLSAELGGALAGCELVDVLASGAYYGLSRLLPASLAWRYLHPAGAGNGSAAGGPPANAPWARLVVTDVQPPASVGLPALGPALDTIGARVLSGAAATPSQVLAELPSARQIELHAHGVIDAREPGAAAILLSPDAQGHYVLTADEVSRQRLPLRPAVLLASCFGASTARGPEPWSLANAFIDAGASSVVAASSSIRDRAAIEAFTRIGARLRQGALPAVAARDERVASSGKETGVEDIIVFE